MEECGKLCIYSIFVYVGILYIFILWSPSFVLITSFVQPSEQCLDKRLVSSRDGMELKNAFKKIRDKYFKREKSRVKKRILILKKI